VIVPWFRGRLGSRAAPISITLMFGNVQSHGFDNATTPNTASKGYSIGCPAVLLIDNLDLSHNSAAAPALMGQHREGEVPAPPRDKSDRSKFSIGIVWLLPLPSEKHIPLYVS